MARDLEQYVLDHFDTAIERHYITPYFQPVIRTISRKLCGFEALARWVDAGYGVIRPDQFIPVLEEHKLIHRLDICIIWQVCGLIRGILDAEDIPVPISVNLSRLDFSLCDIFKEVDNAVRFYQVPRSLINIEITESLMGEQEQLMRKVISEFHGAGFQVWMDDFGSGYSSLNTLKDYRFDELKIDMHFLSSFDQRSRKILSSVIQMAKEIEIQTLAEGVETEEQFRFLRNTGCEKVQGYYFGKPMPYEDAMRHMEEIFIEIEQPNERKYYDDIGKINLLSAVPFMTHEEREAITTARQLNSIPLAIAEVHRDYFSILFYNTAFEETAKSSGLVSNIFTQEMLCMPQPFSILNSRVIHLMDSTRNGGEGKMNFISNEEYYQIRAKCIARTKENYSVLIRLDNLSKASGATRMTQLDEYVRQIYTLFERITLMDLDTDTITPLYVATREDLLSGRTGIKRLLEEYAERWVFPEDRDDYLEFFDTDTLDERMNAAGTTELSALFRTYVGHGRYSWKEYITQRFQNRSFFAMIRDIHREVEAWLETNPEKNSYLVHREKVPLELLWSSLVNSGIIRMFWKDTDRRFIGATDSFLRYYGFMSEKDIAGKNDEDLGWHVHADGYRNDEEQILEEGLVTHYVPGNCIKNGENREIVASKAPIYDENGNILGLLGYFIDKEELNDVDNRGKETHRRDLLTGLLNNRGIIEEAHMFQDEYYLRNKDFLRVHVAIDDIMSLNRQYGFDFGDKAITILGKALKDSFGRTSAVGRYNGHQFVILHQISDRKELATIRNRIREIGDSIHELDGIPLTIYLSIGYSLFSEFENLEEQSHNAEIRLMADHDDHTTMENRLSRAAEVFRAYDQLPISYAVYKVLLDENRHVYDATIFYVNHLFEERAGKKADELVGHSTRQLFPSLGDDWYDKAERAAIEGETVVERMYFEPTGKYYYLTASQVIRQGFCSFTYQEFELLDQT